MDPFIIKWLLSLVVGASWVAATTTIAEKISGKLGGLIIALPATPVVSLLFIGFTQGIPAAQTTAMSTVFSTGFYAFYFLSYLLLTKRSFWTGFIGSLIVWFGLAMFVGLVHPTNITSSIIIWLILLVGSLAFVINKIPINIKQIPTNIVKTPLWVKAVVSGAIISLIVLISRVAGPVWGGVFATFPTISVPTILITIKSGGLEFTRQIIKNVLLGTIAMIGLFAIFSYFLLPQLGVLLGVITAYIILLLISLPLYFLVFEKLKD